MMKRGSLPNPNCDHNHSYIEILYEKRVKFPEIFFLAYSDFQSWGRRSKKIAWITHTHTHISSYFLITYILDANFLITWVSGRPRLAIWYLPGLLNFDVRCNN